MNSADPFAPVDEFVPPARGKGVKTAAIVLLALAVVAVGGGGIYYFQFYRPKVYARAVIRLYDAAMTEGRTAGTEGVKNEADFSGARATVQKQEALARRVQSDLLTLDPPAGLRNSHETYLGFIELNLAALADARPKAEFFAAAADFRAEMQKTARAIQPEPQPPASPGTPVPMPQPPSVSDVQRVWEEAIPRLQRLGGDLLRVEITSITEPTFAELRTAWSKAEPALPVLLAFIRKLDPRVSLATVQERVAPAELKQAGTAFEDLGKFGNLVEKTLESSNAPDLLAFRTFPRQAELSERAYRLLQTTEDLRRRYGQ